MQSTRAGLLSQFGEDVAAGLSSEPKTLSSKYFYDDAGSRLFQEIMRLPEYYLTRAETEIFTKRAADIFDAFGGAGGDFDLIELGAGDGTKTAVLIEHFLARRADFTFTAIDISSEALDYLGREFAERFPGLAMRTERGDYFDRLRNIGAREDRRKVILFLGSNIGNFSKERALDFFGSLRSAMGRADLLFIGFDLHKDPKTILRAYDDPAGVTARFNLNLLERINRELGGDFDTGQFFHYASYHPLERAARSFLISRKDQSVRISALGQSFDFRKWEPVFMEVSQKYGLGMIAELAAASGFRIVENFLDERDFYVDSLWAPA